MAITLESLITEAVQRALAVAAHSAEKGRSIDNINPDCVARIYLIEKEEELAKSADDDAKFWLGIVAECNATSRC